jgi:hypothetical protein
MEEQFWPMVSALIAVAGVSASAITFWKSFSRMKKSEQVRIAHDIGNNLALAESSIIDAIKGGNLDVIKLRYVQYLNVWEWFSFLVNKKQITIQELIDHYKPTMLKDRDGLFKQYPEFDKEDKFVEFRALCKKLECEDD